MRTKASSWLLVSQMLFTSLGVGCPGDKDDRTRYDSSECEFDGTYSTVEEFGEEVVPILCAYLSRCHVLGPGSTYEGCVDGYLEGGYISEECQWDPAWSCDAAQCISEWSAQEEYYQISEPNCENQPTPWRPDVCGNLHVDMSCIWSDGI